MAAVGEFVLRFHGAGVITGTFTSKAQTWQRHAAMLIALRRCVATHARHQLRQLTRPAAWSIVALLVLLGIAPARGADVRYEGLREFVRGVAACSSQPTEVSMEVGADGGVRGEVVTTDGALRFYGTLSAAGQLVASYRAAIGEEYTNVEGVVSDGRIEGFAQSKSCRYSLHLTRR